MTSSSLFQPIVCSESQGQKTQPENKGLQLQITEGRAALALSKCVYSCWVFASSCLHTFPHKATESLRLCHFCPSAGFPAPVPAAQSSRVRRLSARPARGVGAFPGFRAALTPCARQGAPVPRYSSAPAPRGLRFAAALAPSDRQGALCGTRSAASGQLRERFRRGLRIGSARP